MRAIAIARSYLEYLSVRLVWSTCVRKMCVCVCVGVAINTEHTSGDDQEFGGRQPAIAEREADRTEIDRALTPPGNSARVFVPGPRVDRRLRLVNFVSLALH